MSIQKLADGIYVNTAKIEKIKKIDAIIFDCDGVLIDISNSYDLAIKKTVDHVLKTLADVDLKNFVTTDMIEGFKATGGFNDEVDVTYSLVLATVAATKIKKPVVKFIFDVIKNSDQTGIISSQKYLDALNIDVSEIKNKLDYPGPHDTNILYSIFDEIFYGGKLYQEIYDKKPKFSDSTGLIENDVVLVKKTLIDELKIKLHNKIAIVTGRGEISTKYSLKDLFYEFDLKNSWFLEDKPRDIAKPNPKSLIMSIDGLKSSCCMFVGDSAEDNIMSEKSKEHGKETIFCGIYGTSKDPKKKMMLFEEKLADLILERIDLIPKALNLVKA